MAQRLILLVCLILTACGGGGGGSSGPPSVASQWPQAFAVSFPENSVNQEAVAGTFNLYAPTDEAPTNLALTGADASLFAVVIEASAVADQSGNRSVTVKVRSISPDPYNFERPRDENRDNVYIFTLSGRFRGEALTSEFRVTITDLPDAAEKPTRYLVGETNGQDIGNFISALPDLTGDGKPELGVSVRSGQGPASAYIVTSETIAGLSAPSTSIAQASAAGTRFMDRSASGGGEYNLLTGSAASNSVLLSEHTENKLFLYPDLNATSYTALRGNIDPAAPANTIVYASPDGSPLEGRVLGDVNGDGLADLFVRSTGALAPPYVRHFGIIFGRTAASAADRQRQAAPDILFAVNGDITSFTGPARLAARLVADVDADGGRDLLVFAPDRNQGSSQGARTWLIRSAALRTARADVIDLNGAPTTSVGFAISGWLLADVIEGPDFDGDGRPTLLFLSTQNQIYPIDADDFGAFTPAVPGATTYASPFDPSRWRLSASHMTVAVGDVDGDGISDLFSDAPGGARIVRGSEVLRARTDPNFGSTTQKDFPIKLLGGQECYSVFMSAMPVFMKELDMVAAPVCSTDGKGRIIFVNLTDVRDAISRGLPELKLYVE